MKTIEKPKMTCLQLTMAVMLNMLGSSIILMPTKLAEVGTMSILAWLVTISGATTIAYVFAKCGMFSKKSGGIGGYAAYAFGKSGSFIANFSYGVSLIIANLTIAISIVGYLMVLFEWNLTPLEMGIASIIVIWLCSLPNIRGARFIGQLSHFSSYGILIPILILTVIGWNWFSVDRYIGAWNPQNLSLFDGISAGISMTLWGFLGLETASANSEAVEDPEKSVPRAMVLATLGAGTVYVLANNISFGIVDNELLSHSTAPFGLVFATMFSPEIGKFVMALMALACAGDRRGLPRLRPRGILPEALRQGHPPQRARDRHGRDPAPAVPSRAPHDRPAPRAAVLHPEGPRRRDEPRPVPARLRRRQRHRAPRARRPEDCLSHHHRRNHRLGLLALRALRLRRERHDVGRPHDLRGHLALRLCRKVP